MSKLNLLKSLMTSFVVLILSNCSVKAQDYDLLTDTNLYWPAPALSKPDYQNYVVDPTFNTKIFRITGDVGTNIPALNQNWRNVARHSYSIKQTWNADESVMYLNRHKDLNGGWGSDMFIDGQTYEVLAPGSIIPNSNANRWHPTDPNLRILLTENSFKSWNFFTGEEITLMTWSGYSNTQLGPNTGNLSDDGSMAAVLATRNSDGKLVTFAVDMVNNIKHPDIDLSDIQEVDYVSISPLGTYILVNGNFGTGGAGGGYDRSKIYDLQGNQVGPFWSGYGQPSHFDMTIDENGDEVAVGVDKSNNVTGGRIIKRRLSDGLVTQITTGGYVSHTTARALNRPGWVYASTSSSLNWQPYLVEIIAVKLDGSRVERLCHTRNQFENYENQAHPSPSPSGSRVVFASDWGNGTTPIQAYVVDFRDNQQNNGVTANAGTDVSICQGESVTLTASGGASYLWSTGATTASVTVNPNVTTTYTVTAFDDSGDNSDTDEVTVTVNPLPEANAGTDVSICEGESVTLTASGGTSYSWSNGSTAQSISVSPNATTTYTVEVTQNNCTSSDEVVVTVNPIPEVNAGIDMTINLGESVNLTATGASNYQWNTGDTTATISVSPNTTTTYSVTGITNSCEATDTVTVIVIDNSITANAGDDVSICEGESTVLTASGGVSYLWNTGETTASISVNPNSTTTYTVTAFDDSGNNSDTDEVIVTVNPIPEVNAGIDMTINLGESVNLTATGASTYQWNTGDTTATISVSPNTTTTYSVTGITNSCEATDTITVTVIDANVTANAGADVSICEGESTVLTASGGVSYLWSTGETTASITVNPNTTTIYTVTVYNASETNSDTDDVTVIVNPLPEVNAGTDVTINLGETINLTATGASTYQWNTGDTTATISVSPNTTTTYSVTGITNNCEATDTVTVTVIDNSNMADAGEDETICQGYSTTLTATGGDSYLWSTGETTQSILVAPTSTSTYTVTVFEGNNQDTDEVTVFVNPNPNVIINDGGDITMLEGEFITLSASGANNYQWSNGATQPNIAVSPSVSTEFSVTGYINECSDTSSITVNVVEAVIAYAGEDEEICLGDDIVLTASGGDQFLWSTGETTASITVSPEETTEYSVTVYNELDYDNASVLVSVAECNSVEDLPEEPTDFEFLIFPNPANNNVNIKLSGVESLAKVFIYDMSGKFIYQEDFSETDAPSVTRQLNTSNYSRGIYLLKLVYNDTIITKKLVLN